MKPLEKPNYSGPAEMPATSRFLSDAEYRLIQNNVVIGCTDVLIVDKETGEALSGYRQQKPQEGYWFSCGGRMKRGESYQEAGAAKIKEELGVEIDPSRLEFLTAYSTAFAERAQEPSTEGVHTSNAVVVLFVSPEERSQMTLQLNKEHEKAEWIPVETIAERDDDFPPVLQDAIEKLDNVMLSDYGKVALKDVFGSAPEKPRKFTTEIVNYPRRSFEVPQDKVFFSVDTKGLTYQNQPWGTYIKAYMAGDEVHGRKNLDRSPYHYQRYEGVVLGPNETAEITTFLLGQPVTTILRNERGYGQQIVGKELPHEIVTRAIEVGGVFDDGRGIPSNQDMVDRFRLTQQIKRLTRLDADRHPRRDWVPVAVWRRTKDGGFSSFHPTAEEPNRRAA